MGGVLGPECFVVEVDDVEGLEVLDGLEGVEGLGRLRARI